MQRDCAAQLLLATLAFLLLYVITGDQPLFFLDFFTLGIV
jgi:hypothetical protein